MMMNIVARKRWLPLDGGPHLMAVRQAASLRSDVIIFTPYDDFFTSESAILFVGIGD